MLAEDPKARMVFETDDDSEAAFKWTASHRPFECVTIMNFCSWLPEQAADCGGSGSKAASSGQPGQDEAGGGSGSRADAGGQHRQVEAGGGSGTRTVAGGQPGQFEAVGGSGSRAVSGGQPGQVEAGGSGNRAVCGGLPGQFEAGGGSSSRAVSGGPPGQFVAGGGELNPKRHILLGLTFAARTALPERDELMEAYGRFGNVKSLKVLVEPRFPSAVVAYERDDESEKAFRWSVSDCPFKFRTVANFCMWQGISATGPPGQVEAGGSGSKAAASGQPGQTEAGGSGTMAAGGGGDENAASLLKPTQESLKILANILESCYSELNDDEKARLRKVIKKLEDEVADATEFAGELFSDTIGRTVALFDSH